MSEPSSFGRPADVRLDWLTRLTLAVVACGLIGMLATAAWLAPSPRGFGTHQQLGLSACSFASIFQMRCPSCGMTTAWSHLVRGNVLASLRANTGGTLLALLAMIIAPWALMSAWQAKWLMPPPRPMVVALVTSVIGVVTLIDWTLRVWVL